MGELYFTISYEFEDYVKSEVEFDDPNDFVSEVRFDIYAENEAKDTRSLAGKGQFSLILFGLALDAEFPLTDVMDATESILNMSEVLFEWDEEQDLWSKIDEFFEHPPMNFSVCFLERLEVLPEYRGQGLSKNVISTLAQTYYDSCGLWVLKAFPLQHDHSTMERPEDPVWIEKMNYSNMESDVEKAQYKLFHFYQQMGFTNPFDMEYFIAKPEHLLFRKN